MERIKRQRSQRRPSHPGEILKDLWLEELGHTQASFNGKRAISADFAVLLGHVLDTSPRMWMSLQVNLDIWEAEKSVA